MFPNNILLDTNESTFIIIKLRMFLTSLQQSFDLGASYHLTLRFLFLQRGIPQQNDLVLYFLIHLSTLFFQLVY